MALLKKCLLTLMACFAVCFFAGCQNAEAPSGTKTFVVEFMSEFLEMGNVQVFIDDGIPLATNQQVDDGTTLKFTAAPNPGYTFVGWFDGINCVNVQKDWAVEVHDNIDYVARFDYDKFLLTYGVESAVHGGIAEEGLIESNAKVKFKTPVKLIALANVGYQFEGWYVGGQKLVDETTNTLEFLMPNNAYSVEAKFVPISYKFDFMVKEGESARGTLIEEHQLVSGTEIGYKTSIKLVAETKAGYHFDGFYVDGQKLTTVLGAVYEFLMPSKNYAVEARFLPNKYVLNFGVVDAHLQGGSVLEESGITTGSEVEFTVTVKLIAVASNGYVFEGWYRNGQKIEDATLPEYEFEMPNASYLYEAKFVLAQ